VHTDVQSRVRDCGGEDEERRRGSRHEHGEDGRAREAHGRVAGWERRAVRGRDELVRKVRPPLSDCGLQRLRDPVRGRVGEQHEHE
jgi:hypothetical protein